MKIDLSKVKSTTSGNTSPIAITPVFESSVVSEASAYTDNTATTASSTGIKYDTSVTSPASNESENSGFSLTFTSGVNYDLDTLISEKKRNSSSCPLILKVDTKNENDEKIIFAIVHLILNDYIVQYSDDETSDIYYKNQISKVPDYYNVFDYYFNKLYGYYNSKLSSLQDGSISLSTILETINTITHAELLAQLTTGVESSAAETSDYLNKTKVEWELGTQDSSDSTTKTDIDKLKDEMSALYAKLTAATLKFSETSSLKLKAEKSDTGHVTFFWYNADSYNEIAGKTGLTNNGENLDIDMSLDSNITLAEEGTTLSFSSVYSIDENTGAVTCYNW
jgi:hypothetical protein